MPERMWVQGAGLEVLIGLGFPKAGEGVRVAEYLCVCTQLSVPARVFEGCGLRGRARVCLCVRVCVTVWLCVQTCAWLA